MTAERIAAPDLDKATGWRKFWDFQTIYCLYILGRHATCVRKSLFRNRYYAQLPGQFFNTLEGAQAATIERLMCEYAAIDAARAAIKKEQEG